MNRTLNLHIIASSVLAGLLFVLPSVGQADTTAEGHRKVEGVVTAENE